MQANEFKQIYALNWVTKNQIEDQAARNIQKLWKRQIVGHFTKMLYSDLAVLQIDIFAYDRYKNIYTTTLSDEITYTKFENTFESLLSQDFDFPDIPSRLQLSDSRYIEFCFNAEVIRHINGYSIAFPEQPLLINSEHKDIEYFNLDCIHVAKTRNII